MHEIIKVPVNCKTLYLRNIESILIDSNILPPSKLKYFRSSVAEQFLELASDLIDDLNSDSIQNMIDRFVSDSAQSKLIH
jgi:hypothetical protein